MIQRLLEASRALDVAVVAMVFFIAVFGAVLATALSRRRAAHYERMARLPLGEDLP